MIDLSAGTVDTSFDAFVELDDQVLFFGGAFRSLWRTDGTVRGTVLVNAAQEPRSPGSHFQRVGNAACFMAGGQNAVDLWRSDGTAEATSFLFGQRGNVPHVGPGQMVDLDGGLLLALATTANGQELWRSDGTTGGTWRLTDRIRIDGTSSPGRCPRTRLHEPASATLRRPCTAA